MRRREDERVNPLLRPRTTPALLAGALTASWRSLSLSHHISRRFAEAAQDDGRGGREREIRIVYKLSLQQHRTLSVRSPLLSGECRLLVLTSPDVVFKFSQVLPSSYGWMLGQWIDCRFWGVVQPINRRGYLVSTCLLWDNIPVFMWKDLEPSIKSPSHNSLFHSRGSNRAPAE